MTHSNPHTPPRDTSDGRPAEAMRIDLDALLSERFPRLRRWLPRAAVRALERLVCQQQLNEVLDANRGLEGAEFCRGVLRQFDIRVKVRIPFGLPDPANRRVCIVSNHPLGGLDGIVLIAAVQKHYGGQVWFVVNDLLMAVKPLRSVFLPVNKFGHQSRNSVRRIDEIAATDDPIIVFPAGLCSRLMRSPINNRRGLTVADLEWKKMFLCKAHDSRRDIIPVHFSGQNSPAFYRHALWRRRLRIPFNLEQLLLPREMLAQRGGEFTLTIGTPIRYEQFSATTDARGFAQALRSYVYLLPHVNSDGAEIKDPRDEPKERYARLS